MSDFKLFLAKYGLTYFRLSIGVASLLSANFIGYIRLFPTPMRQLFDATFVAHHVASLGIAAGFAALVWRAVHWIYEWYAERLRSRDVLSKIPFAPEHWNPIIGKIAHWFVSCSPAAMVFFYSHLGWEGSKIAMSTGFFFALFIGVVLLRVAVTYFRDWQPSNVFGKTVGLSKDVRKPLSLVLLCAVLFSYWLGTARMSYLLTQDISTIWLVPVDGHLSSANGRLLTSRIVGANATGIFVAYYGGQFSDVKSGVSFDYYPLDKILSIQHGPIYSQQSDRTEQ